MKHTKILVLTLALTLLFSFSAFAKPIVVKFSHVVANDTPKGKAAQYLKKIVEERTDGRMKVEIYPNASLYGDRDAIEALQMNAIQLAAPSFSKFTGFVPELHCSRVLLTVRKTHFRIFTQRNSTKFRTI